MTLLTYTIILKQKMGKITYVTALMDIKRSELTSAAFQRPFKRYIAADRR